MSLTFKDVAEILKLIDASDCSEVVLEIGGTRLVVRRNTAGPAEASFTPEAGAAPVSLPPREGATETRQPSSPPPDSTSKMSEAPAETDAGLTDVRAPMVGTFYRRPSPDEDPFVEEGSKVAKGDPLCLIEVMKLFTTIEAPSDGVIESIPAEDGSMVEFNQLLFRLRA